MNKTHKVLGGLAAFSVTAAMLWSAVATPALADGQGCTASTSILTKTDPKGKLLPGAAFKVSVSGSDTYGLTTSNRQAEFNVARDIALEGLTGGGLDTWLQEHHGITIEQWQADLAAAESDLTKAEASFDEAWAAAEKAGDALNAAHESDDLAAAQKAVKAAQKALDAAEAAASGDVSALEAEVEAAQKALDAASEAVTKASDARSAAKAKHDSANEAFEAKIDVRKAAEAKRNAAFDAWTANDGEANPELDAELEAKYKAANAEWEAAERAEAEALAAFEAAQDAYYAASDAYTEASAARSAAKNRLEVAEAALAAAGGDQSELDAAVDAARKALQEAQAHPALSALAAAQEAFDAAQAGVAAAEKAVAAAEREYDRIAGLTEGFVDTAPEGIEAEAVRIAWEKVNAPSAITVTTDADGIAQVWVLGATEGGYLDCGAVSITWTETEAPDGFDLADPVTVKGDAETDAPDTDKLKVTVIDEPTNSGGGDSNSGGGNSKKKTVQAG